MPPSGGDELARLAAPGRTRRERDALHWRAHAIAATLWLVCHNPAMPTDAAHDRSLGVKVHSSATDLWMRGLRSDVRRLPVSCRGMRLPVSQGVTRGAVVRCSGHWDRGQCRREQQGSRPQGVKHKGCGGVAKTPEQDERTVAWRVR